MTLSGWLKRLFAARGAQPSGARPEAGAAVGRAPDAAEDDARDAADGGALDPFDPFPEPVALELTDVLDLHQFAPRDVRRVVEEYLREARARGFRHVRIVHGKGVGVQREMVRAALARAPFVEHFADAPAEAGGWGATVARLSVD